MYNKWRVFKLKYLSLLSYISSWETTYIVSTMDSENCMGTQQVGIIFCGER